MRPVPIPHKSNVWVSDFTHGIKALVTGAHRNRSWEWFSFTGTNVHSQDASNALGTLVNWAHGIDQGMPFICWSDIVEIGGKDAWTCL